MTRAVEHEKMTELEMVDEQGAMTRLLAANSNFNPDRASARTGHEKAQIGTTLYYVLPLLGPDLPICL